jgi:hypothetical protein
MSKYYITNEISQFKLKNLKAGQKIIFEMPSFCSGDYKAIIKKDDIGFYIDSGNNYFKGCRDFEIKN